MQNAILWMLGAAFVGLSANQKHLFALGWLACGAVCGMLYFY
ncbi:MAG: hypothetical protein PWQ42_548 [Sulfurospirillum sp.]|jgi:hypothetical protein|nr:hypothetical protein [Sulfurospirillum sp.]